jgi:hypothetical protein
MNKSSSEQRAHDDKVSGIKYNIVMIWIQGQLPVSSSHLELGTYAFTK